MPAPRRQGRRAVRGAVIVAALTVLALVIFFLDRMGELLNRTYTVVAVAPQAVGVRSGTPVWVGGVPAGTVRRIAFLPPGDTLARVALDLEMKRAVREEIRRDSHLRFTSARFVGETVLEIAPGSAQAARLTEGDTLAIAPRVQMAWLAADVRTVRLQLDSLMSEAAVLREQLTRSGGRLQSTMSEIELARQELAELQEAYRGGSLAGLLTLPAPDGPLAGVGQRVAEIQRLVERTRARTATLQRQSAPDRRSLQAHVRELRGHIASLRRLTSQPVGTYGRVQRDSAVLKTLQSARASLDSLITESKKHPLRYIF